MNKNDSILSKFTRDAEAGGDGPVGIPLRPGQPILKGVGMAIDRNGTWYHQGSPIKRKELVKLFSTVLTRDDAGGHWLITPAEACPVSVEDAAFVAVELTRTGEGQDQVLSLRTNIDHTVILGPAHPLRVDENPETGEPAPYVVLDGGLEAKLARSVFYELVDMGVEESLGGEKLLGLWSEGHFFPLGRATDSGK